MWRDAAIGLALGAVSAGTLFLIFRLAQPGGFLPIVKKSTETD
jgi:hypothetical protein